MENCSTLAVPTICMLLCTCSGLVDIALTRYRLAAHDSRLVDGQVSVNGLRLTEPFDQLQI